MPATATTPAASATAATPAASAKAGRASRLIAPRLSATVIAAERTGARIFSLVASPAPTSHFALIAFKRLGRRSRPVVYIARRATIVTSTPISFVSAVPLIPSIILIAARFISVIVVSTIVVKAVPRIRRHAAIAAML